MKLGSYEAAVWCVWLIGLGTGLLVLSLIVATVADIYNHRWPR